MSDDKKRMSMLFPPHLHARIAKRAQASNVDYPQIVEEALDAQDVLEANQSQTGIPGLDKVQHHTARLNEVFVAQAKSHLDDKEMLLQKINDQDQLYKEKLAENDMLRKTSEQIVKTARQEVEDAQASADKAKEEADTRIFEAAESVRKAEESRDRMMVLAEMADENRKAFEANIARLTDQLSSVTAERDQARSEKDVAVEEAKAATAEQIKLQVALEQKTEELGLAKQNHEQQLADERRQAELAIRDAVSVEREKNIDRLEVTRTELQAARDEINKLRQQVAGSKSGPGRKGDPKG